MNDTRKMARARAKIEHKKMIKNKSINKSITFPVFFDFYTKNQAIFTQSQNIQNEVRKRQGNLSVQEASDRARKMISEIDDSFLSFEDDDEDEVGEELGELTEESTSEDEIFPTEEVTPE